MPRFDHKVLALLVTGLMVAVPAAAQSPSPLGVAPEPAASAAVEPSNGSTPTDPPGDTAPLPARIMRGTCDRIGDVLVELLGVVAGGPLDPVRATVYASISEVELALADLATDPRVLIVGGESDPESAVACGVLTAPMQGPDDLAIALLPLHASTFSGTALLHQEAGPTSVYLVVVSAPQGEGPAASPGTGDQASPVASAQPGPNDSPGPSDLSPVRSAEPGTSGAPVFSPLPAGSTAP